MEQAISNNPASRTNSEHFISLALAGRGRIAYESKDYARAVGEMVAAFARGPRSAGTVDGLNITPLSTARLLLARVKREGEDGLAKTLQDAIDKLDPVSLILPEFERNSRGRPPSRRGGRSGRRNRRGRRDRRKEK